MYRRSTAIQAWRPPFSQDIYTCNSRIAYEIVVMHDVTVDDSLDFHKVIVGYKKVPQPL